MKNNVMCLSLTHLEMSVLNLLARMEIILLNQPLCPPQDPVRFIPFTHTFQMYRVVERDGLGREPVCP